MKSPQKNNIAAIVCTWLGCMLLACQNSGNRKQDTDTDDAIIDTDGEVPRGDLLWALNFGGNERYTIGEGGRSIVALDDDSFVVGGAFADIMTIGKGEPTETTFTSVNMVTDIFLARFNSDSTLVWARAIAGTIYGDPMRNHVGDYISDVVVLSDGSLGVIGHFNGTAVFGLGEATETSLTSYNPDGEGFVARYLPDGSLAWVRHLEGIWCWPSSGSEGTPCFGVALPEGKLGIAGNYRGSATVANEESDQITVKGPKQQNILIAGFSLDGGLIFAQSAGWNIAELEAHALAKSPNGGFYLVGGFYSHPERGKDDRLLLGSKDDSHQTIDCSSIEPNPWYGDGCGFEFFAEFDENGQVIDSFLLCDAHSQQGLGIHVSEDRIFVTGRANGNDILFPMSKKPFRLPGDYEQYYMFAAPFSFDGELIGEVTLAKGQGGLPGIGRTEDGSYVAAGWFGNELTFNDKKATHIEAPPSSAAFRVSSMIAHFTENGELVWVEALGSSSTCGHENMDLALLSDSRFIVTGFISGKAVFNPGKETETTLIGNGSYDVIVVAYE